ncbi:MAG: family 10 glycosylhydrolase [Bacteroidota bacterium]
MNKTLLTFIILFFLVVVKVSPQVNRETRAVWVSTNFRLDWPPPTYDQERQKKSLVDILDNIKSKNLNSVYFQVRSNGTVLFKSSFEALSPYITGKVGGTADYDPLAFAIEQAHKRGLEIHAWINTVRCFAGTETSTLNDSNHIFVRKPGWVIEGNQGGQKSYWLDPGLPEVREYLSDMFEELAANYDLDGIHLDFIRYPGKNFDDDFSYNVYSGGLDRDEWRRNNITSLIELISKKVKAVKRLMKIGAAPIGVYKNQKGMYGWEGYNEVYQDAHAWLQKGLLDYITPQIYWSFKDNTRFDLLAKEWVDNSFGRSVVLGIGAYKDDVKLEIEKMIEYSRAVDADGVAFFRYSNIKDYDFQNFQHKTYPPLMAWLNGIYPQSPTNLEITKSGTIPKLITLSWDDHNPDSCDSLRYYALYSLPHYTSELLPDYLFDVIPAERSSVVLAIEQPKKVNYFFTLKSVSKLWNESIESSNIVNVNFDELNLLSGISYIPDKPVLIKEKDNIPIILLYSRINEEIEISGIRLNGELYTTKTELTTGKNIIALQLRLEEVSLLRIKYLVSGKEVELKL